MIIRSAFLSALVLLALPRAAQTSEAKSIELVQNQCAEVSKGDIVSFTMSPKPRVNTKNPRYTNFSLVFARKGVEVPQANADKLLIGTQPNSEPTPLRSLGQGKYKLTFTVVLTKDLAPGNYTLRQVLVFGSPDGKGSDSVSDLKTNPELVDYCVNYLH